MPQLDILCHQVKPSVLGMDYIYLSCQPKGPHGDPRHLILLSGLLVALCKLMIAEANT